MCVGPLSRVSSFLSSPLEPGHGTRVHCPFKSNSGFAETRASEQGGDQVCRGGHPMCTHTCSTLGPHPAGPPPAHSGCRLLVEAPPRLCVLRGHPCAPPLYMLLPVTSPGQPRQRTRGSHSGTT